MKAIINGKVIIPDKNGEFITAEDFVIVYEEKIIAVMPKEQFVAADYTEIIDAAGKFVSPGFINEHIHGCVGVDTMDDNKDALLMMSKAQAQTGVTGFLPTTMTYDMATIYKTFAQIQEMQNKVEGAMILGCHMEGPFINQQQKGAQAAKNIIKVDFSLIEPYKDIIKIITIAPETLTDDEFTRQCQANDIIVSIGHSMADYAQARLAIDKYGIKHITHLCNAMTPFHHRKPGIVGAALDSDANCELIADNVHVHPAMQRLIYKAKDNNNIILITDSMRACMLGDGESELGGQKVYVKGNLAALADGTIAGSVLTMDKAVDNFAKNTGADLAEITAMVTKNPAEELGIYNELGSLDAGKQADIIIFDDNVNIAKTIIKGRTIYSVD